MVIMLTWRKGSALLRARTKRDEVPLRAFIHSLEKRPPWRADGTAIYLTGHADTAPSALLHNLKHNKVLHEQNIILTIETADRPHIAPHDRVEIETLSETFHLVRLTFGYMDEPNVPKTIPEIRQRGLKFDAMNTSFFLSRRSLKQAAHSEMPDWQDSLFIFLARRAHDATAYFHIPSDRVVEVGTQITI